MPAKFLIVIVGPTAVGKTALAIALAKHFKTEIVSADSRQFYREMNIGTAKPSEEELSSVKHHLINSLSIHDEYNVSMFEEDAIKSIESIFLEHDVAILCGGSGMYLEAVIHGMDDIPHKDMAIRNQLIKEYTEKGIQSLQEKLKHLDEKFYEEIDKENPHRLIRAIEVCMVSGKKYSDLRKKIKKERPFNTIFIGIEDERDVVYNRINARVDKMIAAGLIDEALSLYPYRHLNALQTVGYRELFLYFDNKINMDDAVNLIKQHTRNYAKRQWTWFKKNSQLNWFLPSQEEKIISLLINLMRNN